MIGVSYVGALSNAIRDFPDEPWGFEFGLFTTGWLRFREIKLAGGRIEGAMFRAGIESEDAGYYDAFVVYGDLFTPHEIAYFEQTMRQDGLSHQLRAAVLADQVEACHGVALARALGNLTGSPVAILSRNVRLTDEPATAEQYLYGTALLRSATEPAIYVELPEVLMADGFVTDPAYHRFLPQPADSDLPPQRDESHMTPEAGRIVLRHIVAAIGQV